MINLRCCILETFFCVLLFIVNGGWAMAQQNANNQQQPMMSLLSGPIGSVANGSTDPREDFMNRLDLIMFEAVTGDLSLCGGNNHCLKGAKVIKSLRCAIDVCDGVDKTRKMQDCFDTIYDKYFTKAETKISSLDCLPLETPSAQARREILKHTTSAYVTEDILVEHGAYVLALKGSAQSCEGYIKSYVGPYGPQWSSRWYRALSGCRILAHKRTRQEEEKDFYTWFGVLQGKGNCSNIINVDMRHACSAPKAASPTSFNKSSIHAQ